MEVKIDLKTDTNNSYPCDQLIIIKYESKKSQVFIKISNEHRTVSVDAIELKKTLTLFDKY